MGEQVPTAKSMDANLEKGPARPDHKPDGPYKIFATLKSERALSAGAEQGPQNMDPIMQVQQ